MFMVKPLSKGCENTSASGTAADSFSAASGVYSSWKCASATGLASRIASAPGPKARERHDPKLLFNVAAVDGDDVAFAGIELDAVRHLGLGKGEVAVLGHHAIDQDLAGLVVDPQRHAGRLAAITESALAGDGAAVVLETAADGIVGLHHGRSGQGQGQQDHRPGKVFHGGVGASGYQKRLWHCSQASSMAPPASVKASRSRASTVLTVASAAFCSVWAKARKAGHSALMRASASSGFRSPGPAGLASFWPGSSTWRPGTASRLAAAASSITLWRSSAQSLSVVGFISTGPLGPSVLPTAPQIRSAVGATTPDISSIRLAWGRGMAAAGLSAAAGGFGAAAWWQPVTSIANPAQLRTDTIFISTPG